MKLARVFDSVGLGNLLIRDMGLPGNRIERVAGNERVFSAWNADFGGCARRRVYEGFVNPSFLRHAIIGQNIGENRLFLTLKAT